MSKRLTPEEMARSASVQLSEKSLMEVYTDQLTTASQEKQDYTAKLELAVGEDVFKYLLLINVAASESFVAQTRIQAQHSFMWAKRVAIIGFIIIGFGVVTGIVGEVTNRFGLSAAYLSALAGIFVEFIGGIFFYLYNRTLQQINLMHARLMRSQELSGAILASGLINDPKTRDELRASATRSAAAHDNVA